MDTMESSLGFSEDITPPLSPVMCGDGEEPVAKRPRPTDDLDILWEPPRFDCSEQSRHSRWCPSTNGFVGTRTFTRLLEGSFVSVGNQDSSVTQLFGFCSFTASRALQDQSSYVFGNLQLVIRKMESLLGKQTHWTVTDPLVKDAKKLREQALHCFFFIHNFIQRFLKTGPANQAPALYIQQVVSQLVTELDNLTKCLGRVSDLPPSTLHAYATSQARQASHDQLLFHFHLDVRWYVIQILHHLQGATGSSCEVEILGCLNTQMEILLEDLVLLAVVRHNQLSAQEAHQTSLFPCPCLHELWLLILHLLDHRHVHYSSMSFWSTFHQSLLPMLEKTGGENQTKGIGVEAKDGTGLCWWLLQGLAPLYQYDSVGQEREEPISKSHWFLVEDLLKRVLSKEAECSEAKLQCYLRHLLALCQVWPPHTKTLTSLWDHFYRKLNHHLSIPSQGIHGLASISKTALSWFQMCKNRCDDHCSSGSQETSFHLFLRILAAMMSRWNAAGNTQPWKQLQGRLYSKFHSRTMQELGDLGLQRFFDLFLTLALLVDLPSLTNRILDFVDLIPTSNLNVGRQLLIWRGLLALCLVHEERQTDLEAVAEKLTSSFNTIARSYLQIKSDTLRRSDYWRLIACYLEGAQEVVDSSLLLGLSEDKFIAPGLAELLAAAGEQEIRSILTFAQTTMARHRSLYKRLSHQVSSTSNDRTSNQLMTKYKVLADALWSRIYPFIRQHASTQTPPSQLADVAASFTLLAADLPNSSDAETSAWSLFEYFGLQSGKVNTSIRTRYLCHLLPNQSFMDSLLASQAPAGAPGSLDGLLVRAWLHASLVAPGSSSNHQMQELRRLVAKLPQVAVVMHAGEVDVPSSDSSKPLVFRFLAKLGKYFSAAQTYQEKLERRSKVLLYLGDLVTVVRTQVRGQRSLEEMCWMYQVVGYAVKHCSNVLYSQGSSQSLLPGLLTELVLFPGAFNLKKPLPPNQLSAIRDTLHLFVEGLAQHDVTRDSYIQRKLKEITCQYFLRFKVKLSAPGTNVDLSSLHPLLKSLNSTFKPHVDPKCSTLRRLILSEFRDRFLGSNPQHSSQHTAPAITFIQELLYRTTSMAQVARDTVVLLGTVLDFLLLCESTGVKGQMSQILTQMMNACKMDTPDDLELELVSVLRGFLSRHIHHQRKASLGRLEAVAVLHPRLATRLIPDCTRLVEECEHRRAVGADSVLRQAYVKFLSHLGPAGKEEILKLEDPPNLE